ncbi:hypothetical protein CKO28_16430 [Rhodovibrio sodomensis]|uniref:Uncharacterized protein n=1 Tax=Rhodovibrio sodomensis TaxID=1088 RepID=A0ABS1DGM0_9PROT|nr:hypothetical protein [Rhodovibrio sodomensis]
MRSAYEGARPLAVDAAAGAGAGAANVYAEENDWGPLAQGAAVLGGGVAGAAGSRALVEGAPKVFNYVVRDRLPDPSVPADPTTGAQPSRATTQRAKRMAQDAAEDPRGAADTLEQRAQGYREADMPAPAAGGLSNDEGYAGLEREMRKETPSRFQRQDRRVEQAASDQVRSLSPGDDVNARASTEYVSDDVRARQGAAQARVAGSKTAVADAEAAERSQADELAANRGTGDAASETIDTEFKSTLDRERAEKNRQFEAVDPNRDVMRPIDPLAQAAQDVKDNLSALAPTNRVLPRDFVNRIDALVPKYHTRAVDTGLFDESGQPITRSETVNVGGPGEAAFADINALRAPLSDAIAQARRNNQGALVQSLERLKGAVDSETARLAEEGGPAAERAAGALDNYRDRYAPRFVEGEGGKFRRDLARDNPAANPPTKTAGRFLRSGVGSKEAAADLQRILEVSDNPEQATQAARQYLLDSLSGVVGSDGKVSPVRLREWVDKRRGALDSFPGIRDEIRTLQQDVMNKRDATTRLQRELEQATGDMKRTERELQDSALSIMVDADPVVAVRRVFGSKDPKAAMREITRRVSPDKAASEGWRKAVADYLAQTVTSGQTAKTAEGGRPASLSQLSDLFEKHTDVLTEVYGPEQMNALRRAQMAVEDLARSQQGKAQSTTTAEDVARMLRYAEIGLKGTFGGLRGGNMFRNLRLAIKTIPGLDSDAKAAEVVRQSMFDPELAAHLLRDPVPPARRAGWNRRLMGLLGLSEGAREGAEAED